MKVLLIAHNASVEGAGIAFANIIKYLSRQRIDVVAVVPGYKGVYELLEAIEGVKIYVIKEIYNEIYPLRDNLLASFKYVPKLIRTKVGHSSFKKKLIEIVEKEKPDLIHTNVGTIRVGAEVAELYNIPHVWHVRECQALGYGFHPFGGEKKVAELFHADNNHCIAITKSVYEYYGLQDGRDCVIYDGVFPESKVNEIKEQPKKNVILYVGLLSEKKGVNMLLDGFEKIADKIPGYELWLAGVDVISINKLINKSKYSDRIKYLGFRKDIYDLMASSRMLVVPSEYEGFGFITAEAMLNKTLVIGRDTAGTKEQMDNAKEAVGFDVALRFSSSDELAQRLIEATQMSHEDYLTRTNSAFKVVADKYTIEKNGEQILSYYKSILKS